MIIHFPVIIWNWKINEDSCYSSFFSSILIPSFFMKCMRKERNLMVKPRKSREHAHWTLQTEYSWFSNFLILLPPKFQVSRLSFLYWYLCLLSNIIGSSYTLCDTFIITLKSIGHRINMHYGRLKWSNNIK